MGFISDFVRANRAGQVGKKRAELKQLEEKSYKTEKDQKQIRKLSGDIERLKEFNKIASEKNSRVEINSNSNNKTITQKNGIFAKFTYHKSKKN